MSAPTGPYSFIHSFIQVGVPWTYSQGVPTANEGVGIAIRGGIFAHVQEYQQRGMCLLFVALMSFSIHSPRFADWMDIQRLLLMHCLVWIIQSFLDLHRAFLSLSYLILLLNAAERRHHARLRPVGSKPDCCWRGRCETATVWSMSTSFSRKTCAYNFDA